MADCPPECPAWHDEQLVEPADLHRKHAVSSLRRRQWRTLYNSDTPDPGSVASILRADDPRSSMRALKEEFGGQFAALRLRSGIAGQAARGDPGSRHLLSLLPPVPDEHKLSRFREAVTSGVHHAIALTAQGRADLVALAREAEIEAGQRAMRARQFVAATPTLAHGPTRTRLRLAGHPSMRRAAGYGRLYRGAPGADVPDASAEQEQDSAPEAAPSGPQEPPGKNTHGGAQRRSQAGQVIPACQAALTGARAGR